MTTVPPSIFPNFGSFSASPSTISGTQAPVTNIPTPLLTVFPDPTISGDTVQASPFRLTYMLTDSTEPSEAQYALAADVALMHIEAIVRDQFSFAFGVEVDVFDGMVTAMGNNPVTIDFNVIISFTSDRSFLPTPQDIDALIELSLLSPNVEILIGEYTSLSTDSPFSTTQSVTYQKL